MGSLVLYRHQLNNHAFKDARITPILEHLGKIYVLDCIKKDPSPIHDSGFFGPHAGRNMAAAIAKLNGELRPQMLSLVETYYIPNHMIPSTIGNYYGDIYNTQYEWARDSRMNKESVIPY